MPRTAASKKTNVKPEPTPAKGPSFFDYLRFGESYTSLILGIIVVIVATALLLSFVHNKNVNNKNVPISQEAQTKADVSQKAQQIASKTPSTIVDTFVSAAQPTDTIVPTQVPTLTPKPTLAAKPKVQPTAHKQKKVAKANIQSKNIVNVKFKSKNLPKSELNKIAMTTHKTAPKMQKKVSSNNNVWVVQKGESLWTIAEKKYTSGYNWVDIARANNLSDPSDIHVGDRLILPNVTPKATTILVAAPTPTAIIKQQSTVSVSSVNNVSKITGNTYTVQKGDNLWNIAVRAYGDGFRWGDIVKANNLSDPHMIFSGNVLQIPRP